MKIDASTAIPALNDILARSAATPAFASAVTQFAQTRRPNELINFTAAAPAVKVARVLSQLLEQHPTLPIQSVEIDAVSGCADFRGTLHVSLHDAPPLDIEFEWNCAWKAQQAGHKTFWGEPDQQRAAQEFGFRCFKLWKPIHLK